MNLGSDNGPLTPSLSPKGEREKTSRNLHRVHGPNACEESNFDATCRVEGSGDVSPHTKTPTLHCGWIIGRCLIEHSNLPSAGLPGSWSPRSPGRFPG